jgi:molybdopterin-guanine dinucleotide biosynthesis protein B
MIPIVSVVGKSGAGKTTFLEGLIREIKRRGYRLAVVKHDTHGFEIDKPGKDTWRMAQAGTDVVVISSPEKMAMIKKTGRDLPLDEIAQYIGDDVDLILSEGYKREDKPKIEVSRSEVSRELLCTADELLALATDQAFDMDVPQFALDDIVGLVDLLERQVLGRRQG